MTFSPNHSIIGRSAAGHVCPVRQGRRGFALIVTLSLMILLTVIAVGLLSLSAISLRRASSELAMAEARSSARLSLMLAINQLQIELGPDQRISSAADQLGGSGTSPQANPRVWTAAYKSWPAPVSPNNADPRPSPTFLGWLVSGSDAQQTSLASASSIPSNAVELVGKGTLGNSATKGFVSVPELLLKSGSITTGRLAWWVGDQGVKAAISTPQAEDPGSDRALVRAGLQGAPRNAVELAKAGATAPFASLAADDARLALITDWQQAGLLAGTPQEPRPLFHDLAAHSNGLLTNVRSGGFRKDLSMYLESTAPPTTNFPAPLIGSKGALYQVNNFDGIRIGELWSYYNLYKQLKSTNINFTTGGSASGATNPHLQAEGSASAAQQDNFFYFKRPVIISYKALFSFYIRPDTNPKQVCFVVDPVVTFWNPYDVPISLDPAYNSIRFLKIPYQIENLNMTVNGNTTNIGTVKLGGTSSTSFAGQFAANYVTLRAGKTNRLIMKPGEVLIYSQPANTQPLPADTSGGVTTVEGKAGFNFGGGIFYPMKNTAGVTVTLPPATGASQSVTLNFSQITPTADIINQGVAGTSPVSANHCETYLFEDRKSLGPFIGIGGAFVDFWRGLPPHTAAKANRFTADQKTDVFKSFPAGSVTIDALAAGTNDRKVPFLYYAYDAKTEEDSQRPGQFLSRLNPTAPLVDFGDLSNTELDVLPFEVRVESNTSSALNSVIDQEPSTGRGFFGGGTTGSFGSTFVTTHSVPREPLVSLGALQHSLANGFNRDRPDASGASYGFSPANDYSNQSIRLPMLPQIAHAIGNSLAPAVLDADKVEGDLSGRPLADHSYLANKALWDDWFFSGIAPRDTGVNSSGPPQKNLASSFFDSTQNPPVKLPTARYTPNIGSETSTAVVNRLFSGTAPKQPDATTLVASLLRVEGLFNVNSTSVEAWKSVLGGLKKHPITNRDANGRENVDATTDTPVSGLFAPTPNAANGASMDVSNPDQWNGRRSLTDSEIETLATSLVEEVRKRGPFLSLADFINRRPGGDEALARAGAVQSAIDAAQLNKGFDSRMAQASGGIAFPAAETGSPAAQGAPGIIKQADILTPIAPILSARSDSFVIRCYGEKKDPSGNKVLARAWCEAVVERDRDFVDSAQAPETPVASLNEINRTFGRRFVIRSFRWLNSNEI